MRRFVPFTAAFGILLATLAPAQDTPSPATKPSSQPAQTTPAPPAPAAPVADPAASATPGAQVEVCAEFTGLLATGVAVSRSGRMFVCFPRWFPAFKNSLVEVGPDASIKPYPSAVWNGFVENSDQHRGIQFVCVQSVKVDDADRLWVLDAAAPRMEGVKRGEFDGGGPKLVEFDLETDRQRRVIRVPGSVALPGSYLNDFEIDNPNKIGYITDSGDGAIILVNLRTYETKRILERHPSTKPDPSFVPIVGGQELRDRKGLVPAVAADGIALDRANGYLYYQPLTGRTLYRISTKVLLDVLPGRIMTGEQKNTVAAAVEEVDATVMTDGMIFDAAGNLYLSALEKDGIVVRTPDGELRDLVSGGPIHWPDSFAIGPRLGPPAAATDAAAPAPEQYLYFTASQIHLTSWFSADGSMPKQPFRVLRTRLLGK